MKEYIKLLPILLAAMLSLKVFSQENLVENYSFEYNADGLPSIPNCDPQDILGGSSYEEQKAHWADIPGWNHPVRTQFCWTAPEVGKNKVATADVNCYYINGGTGTSHPGRSGIRFGFTKQSEYQVAILKESLSPSNWYYVEFYVASLAKGTNNVGISFYQDQVQQCGYQDLKPLNNYDFRVADGYIGHYKKVSGFYKPDETKNSAVFGPFHPDTDNDPATLWDDVKIFNLGPDMCPPQWLFENLPFDSGESGIYQASNKILAGESVDPAHIDGEVIVKDGSNIIFRAGSEVNLQPGFSIEPGAEFRALIGACEANPCPDPPSIDDKKVVCDGSLIQLGEAPKTGLAFKWEPSTYLNNASISNPIFTPPAGNGSITYTVTVKSVCGQNWEKKVTVSYGDGTLLDPNLVVSNFTAGDHNVSFDATVNNGAEWIRVVVRDLTSQDIKFEKYYYVSRDFSCCNLHWELPELDNIWHCRDYGVEVSAKTVCGTTEFKTNYTWDREDDNIYVEDWPNVVTPNGDGVNDYLSFIIDNADRYEFDIITRWSGTPVYHEEGRLNGPWLAITDYDYGPDGDQYWYKLKLWSCWDKSKTYDWVNFRVNDSGKYPIVSTQDKFDKANREISFLPNPSSGVFSASVNFSSREKELSLKVFDLMGREAYSLRDQDVLQKKYQIDLSNEPSGIYLVHVITEKGVKIEKITLSK